MPDSNEEFQIPESLFHPPEATTLPAPTGITSEASPWPARLPFDLALGVDGIEDLEERYELTSEQIVYLLTLPEFQRQVRSHKDDIVTNGISFKQKAKLQAETYLTVVDQIVASASNSAAVRLDAIKSVVRWAGLEPKPDSTSNSSGAQTTRLVFQWADGTGQVAVEVKSGDTRAIEDGD